MRSLPTLVDPQRKDADTSDEHEDDQICHAFTPLIDFLVWRRPRTPRGRTFEAPAATSEPSRGLKKRDDARHGSRTLRGHPSVPRDTALACFVGWRTDQLR